MMVVVISVSEVCACVFQAGGGDDAAPAFFVDERVDLFVFYKHCKALFEFVQDLCRQLWRGGNEGVEEVKHHCEFAEAFAAEVHAIETTLSLEVLFCLCLGGG